jgi:hypothetical protein
LAVACCALLYSLRVTLIEVDELRAQLVQKRAGVVTTARYLRLLEIADALRVANDQCLEVGRYLRDLHGGEGPD